MTERPVGSTEEKRLKMLGFIRNRGTDRFSARVITGNGRLSASRMRCLTEAAEKFGEGMVSFTTRQTVEIPGIEYEKIDDFIKYISAAGLETGGTGPLVRPVVSCKGTICRYGLIDTFSLSGEIHKRFYQGYHGVTLPHKFKIAVGGCPNNCVKPELNDVGIVGQFIPSPSSELCRSCRDCSAEKACPTGAARKTDGLLRIDRTMCINCGLCASSCSFGAVDGMKGYKILIGGRWGKKSSRGRALGKVFTDTGEVLAAVESAVLLFREKGAPGERFADMIERIGFSETEREILSGEVVSRREKILE